MAKYTQNDMLNKAKQAQEEQAREKKRLEEEEMRKEAADQAKPKCPRCGKYLFEPPQCFGHNAGGGGGGGGGGGSGSSEKDARSGNLGTLIKAPGQNDTVPQVAAGQSKSMDFKPQFQFDTLKFDQEVISELLSKNKILVIENNKESGILTLKLQYDPNLLPPEQKIELDKFFNAILKAFNDFKNENGISSDRRVIEQDKNGNILSIQITLPIPTQYDNFIKQLDSKNLLPLQNIEQQANQRVVYPEGVNLFRSTSPKPTPQSGRKLTKEEEERKRSSIRPRSPSDGLKPQGFE